jgi:hypothetical protein
LTRWQSTKAFMNWPAPSRRNFGVSAPSLDGEAKNGFPCLSSLGWNTPEEVTEEAMASQNEPFWESSDQPPPENGYPSPGRVEEWSMGQYTAIL